MDDYYGLTADQWYAQFQEKGMDVFLNRKLSDSSIIEILGRCCIGFESITPTLKKSGWSIDRLIQAEIDYGLDSDSLKIVVGEYLAMEEFDYKNMTPYEIRLHLNKTYSLFLMKH